MPIYEYRCKNCHREMSFIVLSPSRLSELECKYCGSRQLAMLVSRFATPLSEENRLERLADPARLSDLDEKDPQSMARFMKRMGKELGEDMGEDIDQAVEEAMNEESAGGAGDGVPSTPGRGGGEW